VAKRGANIDARLERLEQAMEGRTLPGQFDIVQALPVDRAQGREPGLYPVGPPGSTAGLLVYDPAKGRAKVPEGRMPPWGLLIESESATLDSIL
jgi:hypothetical protein